MSNKGERIVGASAKLARVRQLNATGVIDARAGAHVGTSERVYTTLFLVFVACLAAWRLGEGPLKSGAFGKTGLDVFDDMVLAPSPVYIGDAQIDWGIALALRAVVLMLAAGVIPLLSWMWMELLDRPFMSPFRVVWGVTLALVVLAMFMEPVFSILMTNFVMLAQ